MVEPRELSRIAELRQYRISDPLTIDAVLDRLPQELVAGGIERGVRLNDVQRAGVLIEDHLVAAGGLESLRVTQ